MWQVWDCLKNFLIEQSNVETVPTSVEIEHNSLLSKSLIIELRGQQSFSSAQAFEIIVLELKQFQTHLQLSEHQTETYEGGN